MEWQIIVAVVLAIPLIILPVAFVWYLNIGGILSALRAARAQRVSKKMETMADVKAEAK